MINDILLLTGGILLLFIGGEGLIRGALSIAKKAGVSPLLSGIVIVGFGTSAPELVVSLNAAISGNAGIAAGNIVGSNISNVLLILGICALIIPLTTQPLVLKRDATATIVASALLVFVMWNLSIGRIEGGIFLILLASYLFYVYKTEQLSDEPAPSAELHKAEAEEIEKVPESTLISILFTIGGLILLIGGAQLLVIGATSIARGLDISEAVIGLTVVAVGTSLPELAISVMAAIRKHADMAVGNILGSNIFNILGILGISSIVAPLQIDARIVQFDQWVLFGSAVVLFLFLLSGKRLNRFEGAILLLTYIGYVVLTI